MANGANVKTAADGRVHVAEPGKAKRIIERCPHPYIPAANVSSELGAVYDGWLAYTTFKHTQSIDTFNGYFSVPNGVPASKPVRLYLFTGLQNVDWIPIVDPQPQVFDIIQPVLQTPTDYGIGDWSVKSWWVTLHAGAVASSEVILKSGGQVYGVMERRGPATYFINSVDVASGKNTSISYTNAARLASQPWAYNTLECYGCYSCANEPSAQPVHFTKLLLKDAAGPITPKWTTHVSPNPKCNEKAVVNSASSVDIYFDKTTK